MKLWIDSREQDRIKYAEKVAKSWGWETEVKQLPYGDYVCGNTVVEYKTTIDFIQSIFDGRMKKEAIDQANHFPYHFVFIVGNIEVACSMFTRYAKRQFYKPDFYNAVSSLLLFTNVVILPTQKDAFYLMKSIFIKCNKTGNRVVKPVEKLSRNPCYNFLSGIPRIGSKRAEAICTMHNLKSGQQLFSLDKKKLMACEGIGESLAEEILNNLYVTRENDE